MPGLSVSDPAGAGSGNLAAQGFGSGYGPPLQVVPPVREFPAADVHYAWLLEQVGGGTRHTIDSVPRWDGLWNNAGDRESKESKESKGSDTVLDIKR